MIAFLNFVDKKDLVPPTKKIIRTIEKTMKKEPETLFEIVESGGLKLGGGVKFDAVTLQLQDKTFFDLILHYFDNPESGWSQAKPPKILFKTILWQEPYVFANS